jgi:gas vesicle protein
MGEDPGQIRQEIEQTREQMGETVDALGYKADVKTRAKESLQDKKESVRESVTGAKESVKATITGATGRVSEATPDRGEVADSARQANVKVRRAAGVAQENPIGLALGSVAVGFLAGMLIPASRVEDEKLGPVADQVKEQVRETGQEALERGKAVAQEAAQTAKETAQQSGQEQAEQLKQSAREAPS